MAQEKIAQLDHNIVSLGAMRESLTRLVQTCDLSRARRECPLLDAMDTDVEQGGSRG